MKNTTKLLGTQSRLLCAIALLAVIGFSMAVAGCDNGTTSGGTDTALNGTWVYSSQEWKFTNGNWEVSSSDGIPFQRGTYTTSGKSITLTLTHVYGSAMGLGLESKWYNKEEFKASSIMSDADLNAAFGPHPGTYSISGNTLTLTIEGNPLILTKKS